MYKPLVVNRYVRVLAGTYMCIVERMDVVRLDYLVSIMPLRSLVGWAVCCHAIFTHLIKSNSLYV